MNLSEGEEVWILEKSLKRPGSERACRSYSWQRRFDIHSGLFCTGKRGSGE